MTPPPPTSTSDSTRRFMWLAIFLAIAVGGAFAYQHFTSVYHLATVQPGVLYRDGARSLGELKRAVARVQPKTVICLVTEEEIADPATPHFREEFAWLSEQGIRVERIPIRRDRLPSRDDVQRFLSWTAKPENQPVLIHCAQGVRRTGMMVAAFQMSVLGYDKERAKQAILTFGHSESTIGEIRSFIDGYDSKASTMPATSK